MNFDVTYYSRIYRDFRAIDAEDYTVTVHYYEDHEAGIQRLDFTEYFEILTAYTYALYNINEHAKHILMSEVVVGEAIRHNIRQYKGEDVFYNTLLRKAVSCNALLRHAEAEHILRELIKIKPDNKYTQRELRRCLHRQPPAYLKKMRAFCVFLFFLSGAVIVAELLFIKNFFPLYTAYFEYTRITLFVGGVTLLFGSELFFKYQTRRKTLFLTEQARSARR